MLLTLVLTLYNELVTQYTLVTQGKKKISTIQVRSTLQF